MSEMKMYTGGCHCGAVRYEVKTDLAKVLTCNCSLCVKAGTWLAFVPADQFTLLSGEDKLTDYQFHKKIIHHVFCHVCGVRSFARAELPNGHKMAAINVRCLDDIDLNALTPTFYDGKSV